MAKVKVRGKGSVYKMERGKSRGKCRKWQLRAEIDGEFEGDEGYVKTRVFHGTYSEYCPGCGGTRAAYALLCGKPLLSLYYHPIVLYTVVVGAAFLVTQTIGRLSRGRFRAVACSCTCSALFVPHPVSRETAITSAISAENMRCNVLLFIKLFSSQLLGSCRSALPNTAKRHRYSTTEI